MYEFSSLFVNAAAAVITTTGDKLVFTPAFPVEIISFGYVATVAFNSAAGLVVKLDKRPTAASDTSRGDGDLGTLTLTSAQCTATIAGDVVRSRVPPGSTESARVVVPGEEAVLEVTTALATAGTGIPFIEYKFLPRFDRAVTKEIVVTA